MRKDSENEENSPTWELLKSAPPTEAGPFFSRNVVREVRKMAENRQSDGVFSWIRQPIGVLACAAAAIVILAISINPDAGTESQLDQEPLVTTTGFNPTEEFADVDYFGQLMAVSDPSALDDLAFAELF